MTNTKKRQIMEESESMSPCSNSDFLLRQIRSCIVYFYVQIAFRKYFLMYYMCLRIHMYSEARGYLKKHFKKAICTNCFLK